MQVEMNLHVKFQEIVIISVSLTPFSFKLALAEFPKIFHACKAVGAMELILVIPR